MNSVFATFIFEGASTLLQVGKGSPTLCCMQSAWFVKQNFGDNDDDGAIAMQDEDVHPCCLEVV